MDFMELHNFQKIITLLDHYLRVFLYITLKELDLGFQIQFVLGHSHSWRTKISDGVFSLHLKVKLQVSRIEFQDPEIIHFVT
jgi:hypothetical protein